MVVIGSIVPIALVIVVALIELLICWVKTAFLPRMRMRRTIVNTTRLVRIQRWDFVTLLLPALVVWVFVLAGVTAITLGPVSTT